MCVCERRFPDAPFNVSFLKAPCCVQGPGGLLRSQISGELFINQREQSNKKKKDGVDRIVIWCRTHGRAAVNDDVISCV